MKNFIFLFLLFISFIPFVVAQDDYLVVEADKMNLRSKPSNKSNIIDKLSKGDIVTFLSDYNSEWKKIRFYNQEGYLSSKYLISIEESQQYSNWTKIISLTGENLECTNITPQQEFSIDNSLDIFNSTQSNSVIKLMDKYDQCIRMAYIGMGEKYSMKNIPEGIYKVRVAYGKRLSKSYLDGGICYVSFLVEPEYMEYPDSYDFYIKTGPDKYTSDGVYKTKSIPSYDLRLFMKTYHGRVRPRDNRTNLSEAEFNK
jgi:uncharacterized protein YgiM (DUF1202 family)